jgi:P pilus assembly chaperone PapD
MHLLDSFFIRCFPDAYLMVVIMKNMLAGIAAAFLLLAAAAQAGIIMGGTRVIYQEGKREASISVSNADPHSPIWCSRG